MLGPKYNGDIKMVKVKAPDEILGVILANLYVISIKAKNYHWNTEGPKFYGDHKTYDMIYEGANENIDIIGERMRAMQFKVQSDLPFILKTATVGDDFIEEPDEMCCDMTEVLEDFSESLEEAMLYVDRTTENILQEIDAWACKMAYFTRSVMPKDE